LLDITFLLSKNKKETETNVAAALSDFKLISDLLSFNNKTKGAIPNNSKWLWE
jgi:hypothetical protein